MADWTEFNNQFTEFSNSISNLTSSEKIIKVNQWLSDKQELIQEEEEIKDTVTTVIKKFPIVWNKKELFNHTKPSFESQDYLNYLKTLNKSFGNLPSPNLDVENLQEKEGFNQEWMKINKVDIYDKISSKNNDGKDYYGLKIISLKKMILNSPILTNFLFENYNQVLESDEILCQDWVSPNISLRYKGGDAKEPKNFRPLIVFPLLVRLFDSIISSKLHQLILEHNVIDTKVQKAVLKNLSGLWENSFEINYEISKMQDTSDILFFLDFKNAFGSVNYHLLNIILKKYNFSPYLSQYIENFYLSCFVKYKEDKMKWANGLLQGSGLSNILFLIYSDFCIKNIQKDMDGMKMNVPSFFKAFVDDLVIKLKRETLEKDFKFITRLFSFYGFTLNCEKTYVYAKDEVKIGDTVFKQIDDKFTYLGNSLFINPNDFLNELKEKVVEKMILIDGFDVKKEIKSYVFYQNVFLRISRILEVYYLIHGKQEKMNEIFEEVMYFAYRWNCKDFQSYPQKHLEYIFKKGKTKLEKCVNIEDFEIENVEEKYGINFEENKTLDFQNIFGYDVPKTEEVETNLISLKNTKKYPKQYFEKIGSNFYTNNFVENTN